jgi:ABC-type uncharacterized transport system substrate-binding protein
MRLLAMLATTTIPIVVSLPSDLVRLGFVASLNRPGGNLTGVATDNTGLAAKRFGLLHEMVPEVSPIHVLRFPPRSNPLCLRAVTVRVPAGADARDVEVVLRAVWRSNS